MYLENSSARGLQEILTANGEKKQHICVMHGRRECKFSLEMAASRIGNN
jgi:hypothetical protein